MTSPLGAEEIGEVFIRVSPSAKNFRQKVKAEADAAEKGTKVEVPVEPKLDKKQFAEAIARQKAAGKLPKLELEYDINSATDLKRAIKSIADVREALNAEFRKGLFDIDEAALKGLQDSLDARLADVSGETKKIVERDNAEITKAQQKRYQEALKFLADGEKAERESLERRAKARAKDLADQEKQFAAWEKEQAKLRAKAEAEASKAAAAEYKKAFAKAQDDIVARELSRIGGSFKFKPEVDKAALAKAKADIEKNLIKLVQAESKLKFDTELDPISRRKTELEVEALRLRIHDIRMKVFVDFDQRSAAQAEAQAAAVETAIGGITQLAPALGQVGAILRGLLITAAVAGIVALIGGAASALKDLLPLLLPLPGLLLAGGVAAGVLYAAFKNIPPEVQKTIDKFRAAEKLAGTSFWSNFAKPFNNLANQVLPDINKAADVIGKSLGTKMGELATNIGKDIGSGKDGLIQRLLLGSDGQGGLKAAIDGFDTKPVADIFTKVVGIAEKYMPRLTDAINKVLDGGDGWLKRHLDNGDVDRWIDKGIKGLKDIKGIAVDVWGIFKVIAKAADTAGLNLGGLKNLFDDIAKWLKDPDVQNSLRIFFEFAKGAVKDFFIVLGFIIQLFGELDKAKQKVEDFKKKVDEWKSNWESKPWKWNPFDSLNTILDTAKTKVGDLETAFSTGANSIKLTMSELPRKITSALSGLSLYSIGRDIIGSFINGITSRFPDVQSALAWLTSHIPSWKGPASTDAVLLFDAGQSIINSLVDGMESRYDAVKKSLTGLTSDMQRGFSPHLAATFAGTAAAANARTLNLTYNNYGSSGVGSDEELFAATGRARMVW